MSVKFSIWKVRNDFRFRDVPPGAFVVIEMVKSRVRREVFSSPSL